MNTTSAPSAAPSPGLAARAAAAAEGRDRLLDFLRAAALLAVVVGHWLVAVPLIDADGGLSAASALPASPTARGLTWVFQVMPIFFVVGGAAHAAAWRRHSERNGRRTDWVRKRTLRLVVPTLGLIAVWTAVAGVATAMGVDEGSVRLASQAALVPLWFLSTYVVLGALVPVTHRLHRRAPIVTLVGLLVAAGIVDVAGFMGVDRAWRMLGFVFLWGAVHQIGYFWDDNRLWRPPVAGLVALAALGTLLVLVALDVYPASMVGVDGAERTNNTPPTLALALLGLVQVGLVKAFEAPLRRMLDKPKVWLVVALAGARGMTIYLWHMTAVVIVAGGAWSLGVLERVTGPVRGGVAEVMSPSWWWHRPIWMLCCAVVTAVLVMVFSRAERLADSSAAPTSRAATVAAMAGVVGCSLALAGLVILGPSAPLVRAPALGFAIPAGGLLVASALLLGARPRVGRGGRAAAEH